MASGGEQAGADDDRSGGERLGDGLGGQGCLGFGDGGLESGVGDGGQVDGRTQVR